MRREFTNDSWIKRVEYDTETQAMTIHTSVKAYECSGVPEAVFDAFDRAPSRGKFFNENIKGKYLDRLFQ